MDLGTLITAIAAVIYGPTLIVIVLCVVILFVGFISYKVKEQIVLRKYGVRKLRDDRYVSAKSYTFTFQQLVHVGALDAQYADKIGTMTFYKFGTKADSVGLNDAYHSSVIVITAGQATAQNSFNPKLYALPISLFE